MIYARWVDADGRFGFSRTPNGGVAITQEHHRQLIEAAAQGLRLVPDESGHPIIVDPPPPTLDQFKARKRREMQAACADAIQGGVTCGALGSNHAYPTQQTDQHNLAATVLAAQVSGAAGEPYKFWCADSDGVWARRPHTADQILAVGEAVRAHVAEQQEHYEQKLIEIDQATAETISTITW